MACFFDRDDIAFPGFSKLFRFLSKRVNKSSVKLMHFQTMRGGRVFFQDVKKPERDEWGTPLEALNVCLNLCKTNIQCYQELIKVATTNQDSMTVTYITEEHLDRIVEATKVISEHLTALKKMQSGSEYLYDKIVEREVIYLMEVQWREEERCHRVPLMMNAYNTTFPTTTPLFLTPRATVFDKYYY